MPALIPIYYKEVIDLLLEMHDWELANAIPGHCMKIAGFGQAELDYLLIKVRGAYPKLDSFIVSDENASESQISASRLIELRNKQERPLLILLPANSRTAAEDSYGNNTFKDLPLEGVELRLKKKLLNQVPQGLRANVEFVLNSFETKTNALSASIDYLLALKANS